jgi:hypothetical protein
MRPQRYTSETLFRISSLAEAGGAHLRAWPAPAIGFPLHPLVFRRVPVSHIDPIDPVWWTPSPDGPRLLQPPIDLDVHDGPVFAELGDSATAEFASWWCWVAVDVEDRGAPLTVAAVDRGTGARSLTQRSAWPYTLGASRITRLRLTGRGRIAGVRGVDGARFSPPDDVTGPVAGLPVLDSPWYTGGVTFDEAVDRAAQAAPSRTGPLDRPWDAPLTYDDEYTRVRALATIEGTGSAALLGAAFGQGDLPIRHRTLLDLPDDRRPAQAGFDTVEALLTGAADAGMARWLGLLITDVLQEEPDPERPYAWVCAGCWAIDPARPVTKTPRTALADLVAVTGTSHAPPWIREWMPPVDAAYPDLAGMVAGLPDFVVGGLFVAPVGLGAVADPPAAPRPTLDGPATWEDQDHYGRRLRLHGPIPGPVALVRDGIARNERIASGGPALPDRGIVLLPGRADGPHGVEGALADTAVPADAPVTWSVATADEFGRWSADGEVAADPPERPELPAPVVEAAFVPATGLPPTGPAVAGAVVLQVPVPAALGPGTLPVETIVVDDWPPQPVTPGDLVRRDQPAPATNVGALVPVSVTVRFRNALGPGPATTTTVTVRDSRRPVPLVTGPAVLWAARPDPTGTAELELRLPAVAPGWTHRVYLAEETALRRALGRPLHRDRNRAQRAKEVVDAAAGVADRGLFTLVDTVAGTRFATALPGAVRTLRFLRVVPVTPAGVEADFASCPLVPVAVPGTDRPPAPALTAAPDGPALRVTVTVHGIDARVLTRLNPDAGPRFRLRRTTDGTGDPLYLPVTDAGELVPGDGGTYAATVTVGGLAPFVRHTWQAEVCYPPEIARVGAPQPSAVRPERGAPGDAAPGAWSAASVPVAGMVTVPVPPLDAHVVLPGPTLTLRGAPVAARGAVGDWRLRIWRRADDGALTPVDPLEGDGWVVGPDLAVTDPGWAGEGYALQLVDPLRRAGPLTAVPAPLLPTAATLFVDDAVTGSGVVGIWLRATVTSLLGGTAPSGTIRFRAGDGTLMGEAPLGTALQLTFDEFPSGGTAIADYLGDTRHAPSTSPPRILPESPVTEEGPPDA